MADGPVFLALYSGGLHPSREIRARGYARPVLGPMAPRIEAGEIVLVNTDAFVWHPHESWPVITHFAFCDRKGHIIRGRPIDHPASVEAGDTPGFARGHITIITKE